MGIHELFAPSGAATSSPSADPHPRTTLRPRGFLLIDRQVTDHHMRQRLDLLGLRRLESGRFGFVVIEVKLGKNGELSEDVAEQLQHYVQHIRDESAEAYARCYEKTYKQKRRLGRIAGERIPGNVRFGGWAQHQPC